MTEKKKSANALDKLGKDDEILSEDELDAVAGGLQSGSGLLSENEHDTITLQGGSGHDYFPEEIEHPRFPHF